MEKEIPDMSNAHFNSDRPACEGQEELGENSGVLTDIAHATAELKALLQSQNLEIDYVEADWMDPKGLIEGAAKIMQEHPSWLVIYLNGDEFGIDADYVLFTSKPVLNKTARHIMDLIINEGAELPELPTPTCPKCGVAIHYLVGSVPIKACIVNGELYTDLIDVKLSDCVDDYEPDVWCCPECDAELFNAGKARDMALFLREGVYKEG